MELDEIGALAAAFGTLIENLLDEFDLVSRVSSYFNPEGPYAATSFEEGDNPSHSLSADDYLAVGFLDVPIAASAYRRIQHSRDEITVLLRKIDPDLNLWQMEHEDPTYRAASELWSLLDAIPTMGPTRVSKLLARKRPKLIPIWDSRVHDFFGNSYWTWTPLSIALRESSRRERLQRLRTASGAPATTSLLRVLDVAIWSSKREGLSEKSDSLQLGTKIGL